MAVAQQVLLPSEPVLDLATFVRRGGGDGLRAAQRLGPDALIEEISASGLRGRGGAGFPTGVKWRGVRDAGGTHRYAVCNAGEGEPATFKDRLLLRTNPYQVLEGLAIAAHAVGATDAYVGMKSSFDEEREALATAVREMAEADLLGGVEVTIVPGPEEYLLGEEKGLLEVIEGRDPLPRLFPPYVHGLFATAPQMGWSGAAAEPGHTHGHLSNPTLVNNVETLANVPLIAWRGAGWYRSLGTDESPGTVLCTVVGDVDEPGVVEVEMGAPLSSLLEGVGATRGGRRPKAVLSGVANPVVPADHLDVLLAYEAFSAIGSGLGAAGFAVYDESACMVRVALEASRFLYVESCGQCPACKFGTGEVTAYLERVEAGRSNERDFDLIGARLRSVADANRCYLPVQEQQVVGSILRAFPEEFAEHMERGRCPRPRPLPLPKVVDIRDHRVRYDERQAEKRPDWTYED